MIKDPALRAYWARLDRITRGPLLDPARLRDVLAFNLGLVHAPRPAPAPGDCRPRVWRARTELDELLAR